jgi:hypothetical protein
MLGHPIRAAEYVLYFETRQRGGLATARTQHEAKGDGSPFWHNKE